MASVVRIVVTASARTAAGFRAVAAQVRAMSTRIRGSLGGLRPTLARFGAQAGQIFASIGQAAGQMAAQAAPSIALIGTKIVGVLAVAVPLVGVIGNLLPLIQLLAPAVGAAGLAFGVLKLATSGFADAIKAGLEGDTEKFTEALKKLSPAAAGTARTIVVLAKEWKGLQQQLQQRLFHGAAEELRAISDALRPIADRWLPHVAESFANLRRHVAVAIHSFLGSTAGERAFRDMAVSVDNVTEALGPMARVFLDVLDVAAPRLVTVTRYVKELAFAFANWVSGAKNSGKLGEWLDKAMATFGKLWELGKNLAGIIGAIFSASSDDADGFLDTLIDITAAFERWMKSVQGQQVINLFANLLQIMTATAPVWQFLLNFITLTVVEFKTLGAVGTAVWTGLKAVVSFFVGFAINSFGLLLSAAVKAFGWIPGIGPKLKQAQADFQAFANNVNNAINGIQKTVTITIRARVIGGALLSGAQQSGSYSSGIGGRAAGGVASGLKWTGERGRELVDFNQGRVYNHEQSERIAAGMGGGGPVQVSISVAADPGSAKDSLVQATLKLIRNGDIRLKVQGSRVVAA